MANKATKREAGVPDTTREVDARGTLWPEAFFSEGVDYTFHVFAGASAHARRIPAHNELFLWRLRNDWQLVSAMNGRDGLSLSERKRVKSSRNPAVGRQFGVRRAALRMVTSRVLCCEPGEVMLEETQRGVRFANTPGAPAERMIAVDLVPAGVWLVIGVSIGQLALGVAGPLIGNASEEGAKRTPFSPQNAQRGARQLSIERACGAPASANLDCHTLDIPMPGDLRGAVTCDQRVTAVTAFGWRR
jgi:hypothetical protein